MDFRLCTARGAWALEPPPPSENRIKRVRGAEECLSMWQNRDRILAGFRRVGPRRPLNESPGAGRSRCHGLGSTGARRGVPGLHFFGLTPLSLLLSSGEIGVSIAAAARAPTAACIPGIGWGVLLLYLARTLPTS